MCWAVLLSDAGALTYPLMKAGICIEEQIIATNGRSRYNCLPHHQISDQLLPNL